MEKEATREINDTKKNFITIGIGLYFEGVKAVDGVDLALSRGEILGLIGPNGAGKTTIVNLMTGALKATFGRVKLEGEDVTGWPTERLSRHGVGRTFQNVRLFNSMTVFENIEVGAVGVGMGWKESRQKTWELLDWMHLEDIAAAQANTLPYGQQRQIGILRALATNPRFLLLDEPGAGLNESETDKLMEDIKLIRDKFRCGVMVIEHDMRFIMQLCDWIHVLNYGQTICEGTAKQVQGNPAVIESYLGKSKT